jgi:hypothetical protein
MKEEDPLPKCFSSQQTPVLASSAKMGVGFGNPLRQNIIMQTSKDKAT